MKKWIFIFAFAASTWVHAQTSIGDGNLKASVIGTEKIPVSGSGHPVISGNRLHAYHKARFDSIYQSIITTLTVPFGGTGKSSFTAYAPVFGGTTSTGLLQSGTVGTSGQVLTSNGAGALPTFQAASGGGWPLTGTGTMTGLVTMTSNSLTASADNQASLTIGGLLTGRTSQAGDVLSNIVLGGTLTTGTNGQTLQGVLINPSFSGTGTFFPLIIQSGGGRIASIENTYGLGVPLFKIGNGTAVSSVAAGVLLQKDANNSNAVGNQHGFADNSTYGLNGTVGINSYDALPCICGGVPYDHWAGFQARANVDATTMNDYFGTFMDITNGTGTITNVHYHYAKNPTTNAGIITNLIAFHSEDMTSGVNNYAFRSEGTVLSSLGTLEVRGNTSIAGNLTFGVAGSAILIKEGTNGYSGSTTLVSGTKAITVSGVTTSDHCIINGPSTVSGATLTSNYQCNCTANTVTLRANVVGQTINTADGSTLGYVITRAAP